MLVRYIVKCKLPIAQNFACAIFIHVTKAKGVAKHD